MAAKVLAENRAQLRTQLEVARNNAASASAGNADHQPKSLIDGIVYDLMIDPGELATPQRPVAVVGSASDLYLELEVDEFDIRLIKPGQQVFVTLDSYADTAFAAEVSASLIAPSASTPLKVRIAPAFQVRRVLLMM